jgi:hypothetical protein
MVIKKKKLNFDQICKGNKTKNSAPSQYYEPVVIPFSFIVYPRENSFDFKFCHDTTMVELGYRRGVRRRKDICKPLRCLWVFKNEVKILETASTGYPVIV